MSTTDYTDPATINVDTVIGNITHAAKVRGDQWDARLLWPNVTVLALANEILADRRRITELETAAQGLLAAWPEDWDSTTLHFCCEDVPDPVEHQRRFGNAWDALRSVLAAEHTQPEGL